MPGLFHMVIHFKVGASVYEIYTWVTNEYNLDFLGYCHSFLQYASALLVYIVLVWVLWIFVGFVLSIYLYSSGLLHWHRGNYDCPGASEVILKNMGKIDWHLHIMKHNLVWTVWICMRCIICTISQDYTLAWCGYWTNTFLLSCVSIIG